MTPTFNTARAAGLAYCAVAILGIYAQFMIRMQVYVPGDAPATIANIQANLVGYRLAMLADLVLLLADGALALFLFRLFRPVSPDLALVAFALNLLRLPVMALNSMNHYAPLQALSGVADLTPDQVQAMVMLALDSHEKTYVMLHVFFGSWCLITGLLAYRSGFIPRVLALALMAAIIGYFIDLVLVFGWPEQRGAWVDILITEAAIGEMAMALWLAVMGHRVHRLSQTKGAVA